MQLIEPRACRGARAMLMISQADLADEAGINLRTLMDFETGKVEAHNATKASIETALQKLGVEIIRPGDGKGMGVRFSADT